MHYRQCAFGKLPSDLQVLIGDLVELAASEAAARKLWSRAFRLHKIALTRFPRVALCSDYRDAAYTAKMLRQRLPPVVVCGDQWWDGRHRVHVARLEGRKRINAIDLQELDLHIPGKPLGILRCDHVRGSRRLLNRDSQSIKAKNKMPARDLHNKPFDEGTKTKLEIYRSYVRAWLQVFLHAEPFRKKPLQFFDFFCGPGEDSTGEPGSPLILINELLAERTKIKERGHDVRIFFNDQDVAKIKNLKRLCAKKSLPWHPRIESLDFADSFEKVKSEIGVGPSLVFIDQSGVKHITRDVFNVLTQAGTTDFIFFTASSAKWRFGELLAPEIKLPENVPYTDVHRVLADKYREWAPKGMFIGHFSIKKKANIYGLVFGSHHWRGMQKFLEIVWKLDPACGEADYEMEADTAQGQFYFEQGKPGFKKRKIEVFQEKLSEFIKSRALKTDEEVFLHCLTNGFLPRVAKDVYACLSDSQVLRNPRQSFPRYSADVMKESRKLQI